ncbi:MAG: universal stress protein [Oligoflexus sp.]|nr:universal stress protein [Oligoflexus sp.]
MLELFSSATTIVLGLDLSDEEDKLLGTAVSLAKKTGSRLLLVHAVQPFQTYASAGDDRVLPYEAFEQETYHAGVEEAEQRLNAIRDRLPPELVIDIRVCRDFPENALDSVADEVEASLIVCGIRVHQNKESSWYGGMSTALSLMGSSKFPVMILPLNTAIDFTTREHNILVADNLQEEGLYALKAALGLCRSIAYKQLIHLHVKKTSYREINETVDKIRLAMIEGKLPSNPDFETEVYLKQIKNDLKAQMGDRLEMADKDFAQGLHWSPRVRFGQPIEELQHLVRESKPDILVFGKHHFFRPKGLVLGKVPYQAMIEENVASIVVPDSSYLGDNAS